MNDPYGFDVGDRVTVDIPADRKWWNREAREAVNFQLGTITARGMAWNRRGVNDREHRRVVCVRFEKPVRQWNDPSPHMTVEFFWFEIDEVHATTTAERHPGNFIKAGGEYRTIR